MGLTDYLSRDASGPPESPTNYDEKFVVASVEGFFKACNKIKSLNPNVKRKQKNSESQNCIDCCINPPNSGNSNSPLKKRARRRRV